MGPAKSTSGSPITLTDLGPKISARLDAGAIADSLVPKTHNHVSGMQPHEVLEPYFDYIRGSEFAPPDDVRRSSCNARSTTALTEIRSWMLLRLNCETGCYRGKRNS